MPAVATIIGGPVGRIAGPVMRVVRMLLPKPKGAVHGPTLKEIMKVSAEKTRREIKMGLKSGVKTSEFWSTIGTVIAALGGASTGVFGEHSWIGIIAAAIVQGAYTISRGIAKRNEK